MAEKILAPILSKCSPEHFAGREAEHEEILRHSKGTGGLMLPAEPGCGSTELLSQAYDTIFRKHGSIIPVYFSLAQGGSPSDTGHRFFHDLLIQITAFRRRDPRILRSGIELAEISVKAAPQEAAVFSGLIRYFAEQSETESDADYFRKSMSAAIRAAAAGLPIYVIFDHVHSLDRFNDGGKMFEILYDIFTDAKIPYVFAGHRRYLFAKADRRLILQRLSFADAGRAVETLTDRYGVTINDETRDLITTQFTRNLSLIEMFLKSAAGRNRPLDSFQRVQQLYTGEIFGGHIARHFDAALREIAPETESRKNILGLLHDAVEFAGQKMPATLWSKHTGLGESEARGALSQLSIREFVRVASDRVEAMQENTVLNDYLTARFSLEIAGENRASVFGRSMTGFIKRAPRLLTKFYRQNSAIGIREILSGFCGETIPLALIDYGSFAAEYKGAPDAEIIAEIIKDIKNSEDKFHLPNIVFAVHTAALYEPIGQVSEIERSAVGFGFRDAHFTDESETVWIAAEIDSKLEASREHTEFWCDRLEMAALMCDFTNYRIWLIAPEGFSKDALDALKQRNTFGSSRKQVRLMQAYSQREKPDETDNAHEFEIIVPMGDDTELIAAHAVEEIAKRHNFDAKAINQIKTALVEACINAAEHSLSPDRKIHQKFTVDDHRLTIIISNRGRRLTDTPTTLDEPTEGRRGWGLNLIRRLMDEVTIEQVDDGTRISMTKLLKPVNA